MNNERMIAVSSGLIERAVSLLDLLPESGTIIELHAALTTQPAALPTDPASWPLKVGADEFVSQQAKWPDTDPSDFMHDALYEMIRALNKPAVRGAEHE